MILNSEFLDWQPYKFTKEEKEVFLFKKLKELTSFHFSNCNEYYSLVKHRNFNKKSLSLLDSINKIPWIPVRLFKHYDLKSIKKEDIYKTLYSSGTTGQTPSKIYLDKYTSQIQAKILIKILQDFIGKKRLPMLIIDNQNTLKDTKNFSARGAGILGLSNFGHSHTFALNNDMTLNIKEIKKFTSKFSNEPKIIFGFTFMIWKYLIKKLERENIRLDLNNSILFHSGGWKKLQSEAVDNKSFKKILEKFTSINKIHNFYGMVEQVGSIFVECEHGHLHSPSYSDIFVRDPFDFSILEKNKTGILQVLSILPHSYPGHSILTEDIGTLLGEDDCECGRKGKYFEIHGRVANSENRGCSDTFSYG